MRRVAGLVAAGLGTFLVVLALLIRFVVAGEAVKFPLNENSITTLIATNASYFSPIELKVVSGVTLEDTLTVQGDNAAGNPSRAVWNEFSYIYDETNHATVSDTINRLAFDRRTGSAPELLRHCRRHQDEPACLGAGIRVAVLTCRSRPTRSTTQRFSTPCPPPTRAPLQSTA